MQGGNQIYGISDGKYCRYPMEQETLEEAVQYVLDQITEKNYDADLLEQGIPAERIRHYGFAFEGKKVLIGQGKPEG